MSHGLWKQLLATPLHCEASLPWEPNYTPPSVRFLLVIKGTVTVLREAHTKVSQLGRKNGCKGTHESMYFSAFHAASLTGSLDLPPEALLCCHGLEPGRSTDSLLLLMVRDKGRQENFLRHLFLSKYRAHFPRETRGK